MCLSKITRIPEHIENCAYGTKKRYGYKVYIKYESDCDERYDNIFMRGNPIKIGETISSSGFVNFSPVYPGGFHVFDKLDDAIRYKEGFNNGMCVVCKVKCHYITCEGLQKICQIDGYCATCFCCLNIEIVEEIAV